MSDVPSARARLRALLFSDVEDSTALGERVGAARAAELWAAHDRRARDLLAAHGGREIGRSDGLYLLFDDPIAATRYALDYHDALTPLGLAARVGLHVGEVTLRENLPGDVARGAHLVEVDSLATPVAARLMALARGGQTLLSTDARTAVAGELDAHTRIERHGHYRLKGIDTPVEVYELGTVAQARFQPPADAAKAYRVVRDGDFWLPVREIRHNLPAERDAFVGRVAELRALATRLAGSARLVTLVGPGGAGKTRTVRRYAWTWLGDWPGGVYFCDLSEARSHDGILFAVASALGVRLGREDPVAQLGEAIGGRGRALVILDNFEQVVGHAAATVSRWLDIAHDAAFIVTSRERLHVPGEDVFPIDPLPVDGDGVELFLQRAQAQERRVEWNDDDRAAIAAVVRLVDGLPLAIELAAARVRLLAPTQILERMRERFRLLAGMHGAAARHATLQATIDWSWQLLAPSEQDALAQCATFDGSFTLEAAEAVINLAHRPDAPSAMDAIQALCDKSLLRTWLGAESRSATDRPVLRMYLSVHDFAAQKLAAAPADVRAGVEQRHGAYYAAFGSTAAIESLSRDGGVARRRAVSRSLDNLVTACRRAVRRGDGAQAVDAFIAAAAVLDLQGPGGLAVTLGAEALASSGLPPVPRTRALTIYGTALRRSGRTEEAERAFETALALARAQREARLEAGVLLDLGSLRQGQGRMAESRACAEESLRLARGIGDRRLEGGLANNLGILDALQGQYASARARFEAALALHREVGDLQSEGLDTVNLANLARIEDRNEEAIELFLRALVIQRDVGDRRNEGLACGNLAALHARAGRLDEGERFVEHALAIHREVGNRHSEGSHLATQGELLGRRGRYDEAREAFRRGERLLRDLADPESLALLLCERAGVEVAAGDRDAARSALDEAEALLTELELGSDSEPGRRLMELRAALA